MPTYARKQVLPRLLFASLFALLLANCTFSRSDATGADATVTWRINPAALPSDGNTQANVRVVLVDAAGQPMPHVQLHLLEKGALTQIVQPGPTDAQGSATGAVVCHAPGVAVLTATFTSDSGVWPTMGQAQVQCLPMAAPGEGNTTIVDPALAQHVVTITPSHASAAADITSPTPLTLQVTDGAGNPLPNEVVTLTVQRPGDVVSPAVAA
jgi:hypothetical protein